MRDFGGAQFVDYGYLDLVWVGEFVFDVFGDFFGDYLCG